MPLTLDSNFLPGPLGATHSPSLHELAALNQHSGWFWRTPEGLAFLRPITPGLLDDPDIGNQREED
jgi:hypothetical protein